MGTDPMIQTSLCTPAGCVTETLDLLIAELSSNPCRTFAGVRGLKRRSRPREVVYRVVPRRVRIETSGVTQAASAWSHPQVRIETQ